MKTLYTFCLTLLLLTLPLKADHFQETKNALEHLVTKPDAYSDEDARLYALFDIIWEWTMQEYPTYATYVGYPGLNHKWSDSSIEAIEPRHQQAKAFLAALEKIDSESLTEAAALDWRLLRDDYKSDVRGHRFPGYWMAINQMGGVQSNLSSTINMMPTQNKQDYANIISRLEGASKIIDDTKSFLEKGLALGITPPQVTLRDLPKQFDALILEDPQQTPFWKPFDNMPENISQEHKEQIMQSATDLISGPIREAYQNLLSFLENEYIPNARQSIGMSELPDGQAWYAHSVEQSTTTTLTPEEIHEIGKREVARIYEEILAAIEESGFEGDFAAFKEFFHNDPQFYYDNAKDLVSGYRSICKQADPELVKLFGVLPRLPYGVEETPAHIAPSAPTAYFRGGSLEAGRPGIFYANTYNLKSRPKWGMEALSLHEAVPGHHLQIAIAKELGELHALRKGLFYTAYVEGWGLYAETLGYEMGMYQDIYSRIGQLSYEIWRAIRLVTDTGMHAMGWTREEAIQYFNENSLQTEHDITVEIDRYIVWPSQALAYKIGQMKIRELRDRSEESLGESFDVRAFHDLVLGAGAIPLDVLESRVQNWIDSTEKTVQPLKP